MTAAVGTLHFDPRHAVAAVGLRADGPFQRRPEAGPSCSALELGTRLEERLSAPGAVEDAVALFTVEWAAPRHLGPVLAKDAVLIRRQLGAPFIVCFRHDLLDDPTGS
jgi:hypothetical protein